MKHLIIAAHPHEASFTMSLARAYADELEKLGHEAHTCDLYRLDFNPVLAAAELSGANTGSPMPGDVRREQDHLRTAGAVAFVYPLWWASMPAIMKGYIDRVFSYGFAYDFKGGAMRGLLSGKQAVVITVSAAPLEAMVKSGDWGAVQTLQDAHIFRTCGLNLVEHLHFGNIVLGLSENIVRRHLERVRTCANKHFAATPSC
jgi:NAD(P)H dehydrogenase (quinone)